MENKKHSSSRRFAGEKKNSFGYKNDRPMKKSAVSPAPDSREEASGEAMENGAVIGRNAVRELLTYFWKRLYRGMI